MASWPVKALSWPPSRETILENSPDGDLLGRLEHQVLEEVGDAGDAPRLVGGADPVPDHVGDDRRAVVGDDHHLHAVGELELVGAGGAGGITGFGE